MENSEKKRLLIIALKNAQDLYKEKDCECKSTRVGHDLLYRLNENLKLSVKKNIDLEEILSYAIEIRNLSNYFTKHPEKISKENEKFTAKICLMDRKGHIKINEIINILKSLLEN